MPTITLSVVEAKDVGDLTAFEFGNRRFFERWINARPAPFYALGGVAASIQTAQQNAEAGLAYQYLVREDGILVARVNLTQIKRQHYQSASLGYRVGQAHNGRGIAKKAVRLALNEAFDTHGLWRVEATCRPENPASIQVLAANGFAQFGHARRCFQLGEQWFDFLHFEVHADGQRPFV